MHDGFLHIHGSEVVRWTWWLHLSISQFLRVASAYSEARKIPSIYVSTKGAESRLLGLVATEMIWISFNNTLDQEKLVPALLG